MSQTQLHKEEVMDNNNFIAVRSLSISGYRSFGKNTQRFEQFSKVNLFIGKNNCGKSNVLRFINDIYQHLTANNKISLDRLDNHIPSNATFQFGISFSLEEDNKIFSLEEFSHISEKIDSNIYKKTILEIFSNKAKIDDTLDTWFEFGFDKKLVNSSWIEALSMIQDHDMRNLWTQLTRASGGNRHISWEPETLSRITPRLIPINSVMIPAIRKVGEKGSVSECFSGEGIIEKLVKLQNPDVHSQNDRKKFDLINHFLQSVTDNSNAKIEIPHDRDTILVHMDGKTLPLESLGTGIHEVIILASAATILDETVICMEEPELHLNPILQKKLIRYLLDKTSNQYFITTHSSAFLDSPGAETYHISLKNGESIIQRASSDNHRSEICRDLGYQPSDLLQANCVIWVEGPSDRIYINYWLNELDSSLTEGIHYSIMFYGGRLISHLSGNDIDESTRDFISLRRLNRRSVIVIDSDKDKSTTRINTTKKRLKDEFDKGPGYAWITKGREIENYLPVEEIKKALNKCHPDAQLMSKFGTYDNTLTIKSKCGKKTQGSKVNTAKHITKNGAPDFSVLDLKSQLNKLIKFINESNQ